MSYALSSGQCIVFKITNFLYIMKKRCTLIRLKHHINVYFEIKTSLVYVCFILMSCTYSNVNYSFYIADIERDFDSIL